MTMPSTINTQELTALMGIESNVGPLSVYAAKTGVATVRLPEDPRRDALFPLAIQRYMERTSRLVTHVRPYVNDWRIARVDGVVAPADYEGPCPLIGNISRVDRLGDVFVVGADVDDKPPIPIHHLVMVATPKSNELHQWGPETDEPTPTRRCLNAPIRSVTECQWAMSNTGIRRCDLVALIDDDIRVYPLTHDHFFSESIDNAAKSFLELFVGRNVPPSPDYKLLTTQTLDSMFEAPSDEIVGPTTEILSTAKLLKEVRNISRVNQIQEEALVNKLKLFCGQASGIEGVCSWKKESRGVVDWTKVVSHLIREKLVKEQELDRIIDKSRSAPARKFRLFGDPNDQ